MSGNAGANASLSAVCKGQPLMTSRSAIEVNSAELYELAAPDWMRIPTRNGGMPTARNTRRPRAVSAAWMNSMPFSTSGNMT